MKISPVREELDSNTIKDEMYGLHRFGDGYNFPYDAERAFHFVDNPLIYELIVHKPEGSSQFDFYYGVNRGGALEQVDSTLRAMYRRFEATASGLDPEGEADNIILTNTV